MKIIDAHCHLASTLTTPQEFFEGISENIYAKYVAAGIDAISKQEILATIMRSQNDHNGDQLKTEQREAGIYKCCLLAPDFSFAYEKEPTYKQVNDHHIAVCARHKEHFIFFAGVDPRWGQPAADYFESIVRSGKASGFKLYPPCGFSPSDPICFPFYEICAEYKIPVLLHTGPTSPSLTFRYNNPSLIDPAAQKFGNVNFICAHGAINNWQEHILLAKYRANIFLDVSGFVDSCTGVSWQSHLAMIFKCGINHKLIFGTDWPVFKNKGSFSSLLDEIYGANFGLSASDMDNFMFANFNRLIQSEPR
jgi:uncharacterized protein